MNLNTHTTTYAETSTDELCEWYAVLRTLIDDLRRAGERDTEALSVAVEHKSAIQHELNKRRVKALPSRRSQESLVNQ